MPTTPPPTPPSSPTPPTPPASLTPGQPAPPFSRPGGAGIPSNSIANQRRFDKLPPRPTLHPRRVVGGVRLQSRPPTAAAPNLLEPVDAAGEVTDPSAPPTSPAAAATPDSTGWTWVSARWMRPVEDRAPGEQLGEGLDYARAGQTRALDVKPGLISTRVQGRMPQAYKCAVRLPTFTPEQWEAVSHQMASQAKYAASLLAGELPTNIEDIFAPAGLHLFPAEASDLSVSCECDIFNGRVRDYTTNAMTVTKMPASKKNAAGANGAAGAGGGGGAVWCKHLCCTMFLVADMLGRQPLAIFSLRGLAESDLVERLRQARALQGMQRAGASAAPVYVPHVAGVPSAPMSAPLEDSVHAFWTSVDPGALDGLDMPIAPPEVSHPLLRRVGPSPFTGAKFPITGLLATCYDVISEDVIRRTQTRE